METLKEESGKQAITVAFLSLPGMLELKRISLLGMRGKDIGVCWGWKPMAEHHKWGLMTAFPNRTC